jgi:hypothetical protein
LSWNGIQGSALYSFIGSCELRLRELCERLASVGDKEIRFMNVPRSARSLDNLLILTCASRLPQVFLLVLETLSSSTFCAPPAHPCLFRAHARVVSVSPLPGPKHHAYWIGLPLYSTPDSQLLRKSLKRAEVSRIGRKAAHSIRKLHNSCTQLFSNIRSPCGFYRCFSLPLNFSSSWTE